MSKTVFDHLTESIDQVVKGRRYIIAEIGKVKTDVEDLRDIVQKSSGGSDMAAMVNDLKGFTQKTLQTLTELKNTVGQLGGVVKNLQQQVQSLQMRGAAAPQQPAYQQPQQPVYQQPQQPVYQQPQQPVYQQPQQPVYQQPMAAPQAAPQAAAAGGLSGPQAIGAFDKILATARSGTVAKDLGAMLDSIRTALSKANPLNPILFELSMEAGRLKSLGASPLDPSNLSGLEQKITKWKSKC